MEHINILQNNLIEKMKRNSQYSLRSYAKYLDFNSGSLSDILNGKRKFPKGKVEQFIEKLKLEPEQADQFRDSVALEHVTLKVLKDKKNTNVSVLSDKEIEDHKSFIERWEPFAILNFIELRNIHKNDLEQEIAQYFGLKLELVRELVELILGMGHISFDTDGYAYRVVDELGTTNDISIASLKTAHANILDLAKEHLNDDVDKREFQALTIKASKTKIQEAKMLIRDFSQRLSQYLKSDNENDKDVYQFNLQLFGYKKN